MVVLCLICFYKKTYQQLLWYCVLPHDSQRLRPTLHDIITSKIKTHSELVNSSRSSIRQGARAATSGQHFMRGQLESYQLPKQKHQNGISLAGTLLAASPVSPVMAPGGKAQAAAKDLLNSILDAVVRIFGEICFQFSCCSSLFLKFTFVFMTLKLNSFVYSFREPCCCWGAYGIKVLSTSRHEHTKINASRRKL